MNHGQKTIILVRWAGIHNQERVQSFSTLADACLQFGWSYKKINRKGDSFEYYGHRVDRLKIWRSWEIEVLRDFNESKRD